MNAKLKQSLIIAANARKPYADAILALTAERDAMRAALRKVCDAPDGIAVINAVAEARALLAPPHHARGWHD